MLAYLPALHRQCPELIAKTMADDATSNNVPSSLPANIPGNITADQANQVRNEADTVVASQPIVAEAARQMVTRSKKWRVEEIKAAIRSVGNIYRKTPAVVHSRKANSKCTTSYYKACTYTLAASDDLFISLRFVS